MSKGNHLRCTNMSNINLTMVMDIQPKGNFHPTWQERSVNVRLSTDQLPIMGKFTGNLKTISLFSIVIVSLGFRVIFHEK